jgi:hypothetical protein
MMKYRRVRRVLTGLDELLPVLALGELPLFLHVLLVEVAAALGAEHDRKVADVHLLRLLLDAALDGQ